MERELWPLLYHHLRTCANDFRQKYVQIPAWVLVAVSLWAALHDRTIAWACDHRHWSTTSLRPRHLPSPSTMSRRAYSTGVGLLWHALEQRLRTLQEPRLMAFVDGKPLPVGGYTKDHDAGYGRGAGVMAKGYKLHTIWSSGALPEAWDVASLAVSEKAVAPGLLTQVTGGGYLLADGNYDASTLFDLAFAAGYQLVVPINHPNAGQGHHYQSPQRLRCIELLRSGPEKSGFGARLYQARTAIERSFGNATVFAGGLGPLPAWVRGLRRVRIWVWAKLLINAVRILKKQGLTASLQ
jgi:hypothetical protein